MAEKFKFTPADETILNGKHPDAPLFLIESMTALIGKSRDWIIRQYKNGNFHAYEWGMSPYYDSRGQKIELQTHPDSALACKILVDARTKANWLANAQRLNANKPINCTSGAVPAIVNGSGCDPESRK